MDAGLVTSLSGALAQAKRTEVIANNLANADTVGFKSDDLIFEEHLLGKERADMRADLPERPFKDSEILSRVGDESRAVLYGSEFTDLKSGGRRATSNPLDVAIEGNGFLEVATPSGIRLTRAGNLAVDGSGRLVTQDGFLVLGPGQNAGAQAPAPAAGTATVSIPTAQNPAQAQAPAASGGSDPALRAINVGSGTVNIDQEGNIYGTSDRGHALLGKLSLVQVGNPSALKKEGRNLFEAGDEAQVVAAGGAGPAGAGSARNPASATQLGTAAPEPKENPLGPLGVAPRVHQGQLETSNVDPVREMTRLIDAHRMFDQNTKLMQTIGDANGRVSEVGKY